MQRVLTLSSDDHQTARFIREALPLLSSYLSGEDVPLDSIAADGDEESVGRYTLFERLVRMRIALAYGIQLKPILDAIEQSPSAVSELEASESKGVIVGRLNVQLYLSRRYTNFSWPRSFPVFITKETPNTPENQLAVHALGLVKRRLSDVAIIERSAERVYCLRLIRWLSERLHAEQWRRVSVARSAERLHRESAQRIRKRQTGNDLAYTRLLEWYNVFQRETSAPGEPRMNAILDIFLAFPAGDPFEDRIFEIWCLQQTIHAFQRCGAVVLAGPRPLWDRRRLPICEFAFDDRRISIWFQRGLPSAHARWKYLHSGRVMGGIPDITVLDDSGGILLIDAKRRSSYTPTRAEESYKMLGYRENFRSLYDAEPFFGVLCFLSGGHLFTQIETERGERLYIIGAHPEDSRQCSLAQSMDTVVANWLQRAPQPQSQSALN